MQLRPGCERLTIDELAAFVLHGDEYVSETAGGGLISRREVVNSFTALWDFRISKPAVKRVPRR